MKKILHYAIAALMLLSFISQKTNAQSNAVIAVTPDSTATGTTVTLTISGSGTLFTQATSSLRQNTSTYNLPLYTTAIFATSISIINDSTMVGTFAIPIGLNLSGLWNVYADLAAPMVNGFKIYSSNVVVSGIAYYDDNANCVKDGVEPNQTQYPGTVTIQPGNIVTHTDNTGYYMAELPLGTYNATIHYNSSGGNITCPATTYDTLHIATAVPVYYPNQNFAISRVFISGYVYHDANGNCVFDAGETPVQNCHIISHQIGAWNIYSHIVDSNGYYSSYFPTGNYDLTFNAVIPGGSNLLKTCPPYAYDTIHIATATSVSLTNQNIGINYVTLTGNIYHDLNGNCIHDTSDVGFHGGMVKFMPGSILAVVGASGFYTMNVPVGTYTGTLNYINPSVTCCHPFDTVNIASSVFTTIPNNDFGVDFTVIEGNVYRDMNGNCIRDTLEPKYYNAHVKLLPLMTTTTIDTNGFYRFTVPISNATYNIHLISLPYNFITYCPNTINTTTASDTISNINIGVHYDVVSGYVYRDLNNNCIKDAGDSVPSFGIINITPNNVYAYFNPTTGYYSAIVPVGFYTNTVTYNTYNSIVPCLSTISVPVASNSCSDFANNNFGINYNYVEGYVYDDLNADCTHDFSEPAYTGGYVLINPGNIYAYLYNGGHYKAPIPLGTYIATLTMNYYYSDVTGCPNSDTMHISGTVAHNFTGPDFGVTYDKIQGTIYVDGNSNCLYDTTDSPYNYGYVVVSPGSHYGYGGHYSVQVPTGSYVANVHYYPDYYLPGVPACPSTGQLNVTVPGSIPTVLAGNDMSVTVDTCILLRSGVSLQGRRPCHTGTAWATVQNMSFDTARNVVLTVTIDTALHVYSAIPTWTSHVGNVYTFLIPAISPQSYFQVSFIYLIHCGIPLGQLFCINANAVTSQNPCSNTSMQNASYCDTTALPYDPNVKKTISPSTVNINNTDELTYEIDFQNVGTDTAHDVVITDVLPGQLLPYTLVPGMSSFPYSFSMYGSGIAKFIFHNINLPDSTSDEPGSHGFVQFSIQQRAGNFNGAVIQNRASIYFDNNPPVITNYTHNVVQPQVNLHVKPTGNSNFMVYPNPFTNSTTFVFGNKDAKPPYSILIYDIAGKKVKEVNNIITPTYEMSRDNLRSGIYFYRITDAEKQVGVGKLVMLGE